MADNVNTNVKESTAVKQRIQIACKVDIINAIQSIESVFIVAINECA